MWVVKHYFKIKARPVIQPGLNHNILRSGYYLLPLSPSFIIAANAVAIICRMGETTIISTRQPTKLILASYNINGCPNRPKSYPGWNSLNTWGPQITVIIIKVTAADNKESFKILFNNAGVMSRPTDILPAIYHPTGKPIIMQKTGTPIPNPTQIRSAKI